MGDTPPTAGYWSKPVLESVLPVIEDSRHVRTSTAAVESVASWMAYEDFGFPAGGVVEGLSIGTDPDHLIDLTMFETTLNFAFTDFDSGMKFEVVRNGRVYSDTEAMVVCIQDALGDGVPLLDGTYLATITRADLERVFTGTIRMPMLDERVSILNEVGQTLAESYGGRFHNFVRDCAPAMYADGDGILERLVTEFPRFNDVSEYYGTEVKIYKLAQLGLWMLHRALHGMEDWQLTDLPDMTAFADYIVPVGLHVMEIIGYTDDLEDRINTGTMIERDSEEEIEIRAHTLYATALLTDEINAIRPPDKQLLIPQIDYRLWKTYHATFHPHHLTRTVMY
jgi:putative queuosine salvage protein